MAATNPELPWSVQRGEELRKQAKRAFGQAIYLEQLHDAGADAKAREALSIAASATYWLEDTELEEVAHEELDRYGRFVRETFPDGCILHWTGRSYEHRCPVRIAHKRFGFSIGFTAKRLCSICGSDLSECEHLPGHVYEVQGGRGPHGYCRVCMRRDCTEHVPEQTYPARVGSVITEIETLEEISLVEKPQQPDARLTAIPVDTKSLQDHLGRDFRPGMTVTCSQCLDPCAGFERFEMPNADPGGPTPEP